MINKKNRLQKNKHFNYVYKKGKAVHCNTMTLVFIKTKFKYYKVGFSISTKVGKANVRNLIKRRLKSCFFSLSQNIDTSYNYIFIAKKELCELDYEEMKKQMVYLLKKSNTYVD